MLMAHLHNNLEFFSMPDCITSVRLYSNQKVFKIKHNIIVLFTSAHFITMIIILYSGAFKLYTVPSYHKIGFNIIPLNIVT